MALDLGYDISNKDIKGKDALETKAKIQENYARVDVYFQTLNVKSIVQSALYPVRLHCAKHEVVAFETVYVFRLILLCQTSEEL